MTTIPKKRGEAPSFMTFVQQDDGSYQYQEYQTIHAVAGDTDSAYLEIDSVFPNSQTRVDQDQLAKEVTDFADRVSREVDSYFPGFMQQVFNVGPDRMHTETGNVIATDRETVSDRSFFKASKNYMMHVIDKEGDQVDEYKITGLEIRKTDTPPVLKNFLEALCIHLMHDATFNDITSMIDDFKEVYHRCSFKEIGRPMSVKVLKTYQDEYFNTGELGGVPYHARASIYYNSLCGPNDPKIRPGDKVSVVAIKNGKLANHIAVPVDAERLPDFVDEFEINWKVQWEAAHEKIRKYLAAVGWDRDSRQKEITNSLVQF